METRTIKTEEEINKIEELRKEVFFIKELGTYYKNELQNKKEYALATYDDNKVIAGVYFHRFDNMLVIDQLFVKKEYRLKGIGKNLLNYLWINKTELEKLLGGELTNCKIESRTEISHLMYKNMGFKESKTMEDTFFKRM